MCPSPRSESLPPSSPTHVESTNAIRRNTQIEDFIQVLSSHHHTLSLASSLQRDSFLCTSSRTATRSSLHTPEDSATRLSTLCPSLVLGIPTQGHRNLHELVCSGHPHLSIRRDSVGVDGVGDGAGEAWMLWKRCGQWEKCRCEGAGVDAVGDTRDVRV